MRVPLALLALPLMTVTAEAGVVVHFTAKDLASGQTSDHDVFYAQDGMLRMDSLDNRGNVVGMSLVRDGVVWEVDVRKHTFYKIDKSFLQNQMQGANAQIDAALAQLSPEKRALMEQRVLQMQQPRKDHTFSDAGRSEQSGTYSCHVWQEKRADQVTAEYCVVPPGSLPGGDELAASMRQALATAKDVFSGAPQLGAVADHFSKFGEMNGFPVLTRHLSGGKPYREEFVKSIERQGLPADKFAIPKGFTEQSPGSAGP